MLLSRIFEPKEDVLIYHYCSADAFHSICSSNKIRLSDLHAMNDFTEMHWGYSIWEAAAGNLLNEVGKDFLDEIDKVLHGAGLHTLNVGACFSLDGDLLGQWRAYADGGHGYAIGFKASDLIELPIRPLKVLYDRDEQIRETSAWIRAIHEVERQKKAKFGSDFVRICAVFSSDLASLKNPGFVEEKEVRLIHALGFEPSNDTLKLVDDGGYSFGTEVEGQDVSFFMRGSIPVPYIDLDYTNGGTVSPIKEVVLGPKNDALPTGISIYLETQGIPSVRIRRSHVPYR